MLAVARRDRICLAGALTLSSAIPDADPAVPLIRRTGSTETPASRNHSNTQTESAE